MTPEPEPSESPSLLCGDVEEETLLWISIFSSYHDDDDDDTDDDDDDEEGSGQVDPDDDDDGAGAEFDPTCYIPREPECEPDPKGYVREHAAMRFEDYLSYMYRKYPSGRIPNPYRPQPELTEEELVALMD